MADITPATDIQNFLAAANKAAARAVLDVVDTSTVSAAQGDATAALARNLVYVNLPDGTYNATVDDMHGNILTDVDASNQVQVTLPLFADAFASGGSIKIQSGREWESNGHFISVYTPSSEWSPNRFILGSQATMFSLYSTGVGDYLELVPIVIDGDNYWKALNFIGLWQDRD